MGIVGKSLGATKNVASKARSTGGLVRTGMESYARGQGGLIGKSLGAMAKHPGITMGAGAAIGYGAYRHRARGSQNKALGPIGPMDQ